MTARTAAYDAPTQDGEILDFPVIAAEIIYKGTPVFIKAASGHAFSNDGTTNTLAAGDVFVGICDETVDNSAGAAAAKNVIVRRRGCFNLPIAGTVTQAKHGDPVYVNNVSDDSTTTLTSDSGNPEARIGTLVKYVDSDNGFVSVDRYVDTVVANAA